METLVIKTNPYDIPGICDVNLHFYVQNSLHKKLCVPLEIITGNQSDY